MGKLNGASPPVNPVESVQGMLKHLANIELTKDGRVLCWNGNFLSW